MNLIDNIIIRPGYVYILKNNLLGGYKIGITTAPKTRFKALSVGSKSDLIAYFKLEHYREIEKYLHSKYTAQRVPQSEWFDLTVDDISNVIAQLYGVSYPEYLAPGWDIHLPMPRLEFTKQEPYSTKEYSTWFYFSLTSIIALSAYLAGSVFGG